MKKRDNCYKLFQTYENIVGHVAHLQYDSKQLFAEETTVQRRSSVQAILDQEGSRSALSQRTYMISKCYHSTQKDAQRNMVIIHHMLDLIIHWLL